MQDTLRSHSQYHLRHWCPKFYPYKDVCVFHSLAVYPDMHLCFLNFNLQTAKAFLTHSIAHIAIHLFSCSCQGELLSLASKCILTDTLGMLLLPFKFISYTNRFLMLWWLELPPLNSAVLHITVSPSEVLIFDPKH